MKKRLLSMLLVLVMVAGFVPITALADGEPGIIAQGTCGASTADDVNWVLTDNGVLTISGNGAMKNYTASEAKRPPWEEYKDQITSVVVEDGVTAIGNKAFYRNESNTYDNLSKATIADTVEILGTSAFQYTALEEVTLPRSLTTLNGNVFTDCVLLKTINIPTLPNMMGSNAFTNCSFEKAVFGGSEIDCLYFLKTFNEAFANAEINYLGGMVTAIAVSKYRTEYYLHETLDLTGATVTATLSTGETGTLAGSFVEGALDSESPGEKTVTISYKEITTQITVTVLEESAIANGSCGKTVSWTLKSDGTLIIRGEEAMSTYSGSVHPGWFNVGDQIQTVTVEEGVTTIGDYAFFNVSGYTNLRMVTLPRSLTQIKRSNFGSSYMPTLETVCYGGTAEEWAAVTVDSMDNELLNSTAIIFAGSETPEDQVVADAVIAKIDAIGTPVTLESETAITAARAAYEALTDAQKALVTNINVLTAAEAALAQLKQAQADQEAANAVIALINALPTEVAPTDEAAITEARAAYDALTDNQKALVTNVDTLTAAEAALAALQQAVIDQAAADAVIALINALPTDVALTDEAAITEARAAYNALTDAQKALVTNLDALTTAETALQTLQDQAAAGTVNDAISALPAADAITLDDEAAVAAARAAYDALTPAQQALVDDSALVAAETAIYQLKAEAVTNLIAALPAADAVTLENEADIAAARAAYDALTDAQKALVDASALVAAEARIAELKFGTVKPVVKAENDKKTGKIQLTITPVAGAVKYHILVSDKADGTYTEAATVTGTTYTYEGTPGTQYFFKVVAENAAGVESAESAVVSLFRLPAQVTGLKVKSKKKKEVTLTWKKVTGAKKYVIYMSKNGKTGWKKIGTVKTNKFTYKKAPAGKKMYFRVQALTANGKKGEFSKAVSVKVKK